MALSLPLAGPGRRGATQQLLVGGDCRQRPAVVTAHVPAQPQIDQRPGPVGVPMGLARRAHEASCTGVNCPAARACSSAVAPGLRMSASR